MKVSTSQERLNQLFDSDPRTDSAIADALSVSKQTISMWRHGTRSPKKPMLVKIANMYNVDVAWVLGFEDDKPEPSEPKTVEAKIVSFGMDQLPKEQREQILNVVRAMFANHPELFEERK